jgi:hypothetical protein
MKRVPVSSSNIASVGYDDKTHTLEVEFHSGHVYQYFDVPRTIFDGLLSAGSVGQYFNQIKGIYRYARI